MCCRYVLLQEHAKSLLEKLGVPPGAGALPPDRYNIAPGGRIPAIRPRAARVGPAPADAKPGRELASLHWGLVPAWSRDAAHPAANARAESLAARPSFRDALRSRRCLIPAGGFYEWKISGRAREPWLFRLRDGEPFAFAGLWESRRDPSGEILESCAVITTAPNSLMEPVHHRMPALLASPAAWDAWLDPGITSMDTLAPLLRPFPAGAMTAAALGPHVNNIRHEGPACLEPARSHQLGLAF